MTETKEAIKVVVDSNGQNKQEALFYDVCSLSQAEMRRLAHEASPKERVQKSLPISQISPADTRKIFPMPFWDHAKTLLFLACGVPNGVFVVPGLTYLTGRFVLRNVPLAFQGLAVVLIPLALFPQKFVPSSLQSWLSVEVLKYFSFRLIVEQDLSNSTVHAPKEEANPHPRPRILVAPPHGVFPYGNIMTMLFYPCFTGHQLHGLAANSALRVPGFKQILRSIGIIDASRESARKALECFPYSIGISTGGVAEVFETNSHDEVILLKERVGLIKLAIRTGADIVPCYVFGNTKILSCWVGEGVPGLKTFLERISRKIGFAAILFFGRWGLPIPCRVPLLAVSGKGIPTHHLQCEEPSEEQVASIQDRLIAEMQSLFDRYKPLYGWEEKTLIIK